MSWEDIPSWATDVAASIMLTVKQKDPHTFYHCLRVGRGSRRLAKAAGLNEFEQAIMEFSGMFHDVGKVGIADAVLLKPGRLTVEEINEMKSHTIKSAAIIEPLTHIPFFRMLLPGIRYHHEKIDGTGYPFGLAGDKIPMAARLIAVVDTFDAMTNTRPYRKALPLEKVKKELIDFSGSQFDPAFVKVFLELWPHLGKDKPDEEVAVAKILKAA